MVWDGSGWGDVVSACLAGGFSNFLVTNDWFTTDCFPSLDDDGTDGEAELDELDDRASEKVKLGWAGCGWGTDSGDDRDWGGSWTSHTGFKSEVFEGCGGDGNGIVNAIAWSASDNHSGRPRKPRSLDNKDLFNSNNDRDTN